VSQSDATVQAMSFSSTVVMSARCEDAAQLSAGSAQVPAQNERHLSPARPTRFRLLLYLILAFIHEPRNSRCNVASSVGLRCRWISTELALHEV